MPMQTLFRWRARPFPVRGLSPIQLIALGFLALIAVGTLLLALPISQRPGMPVSLLDCLFTATSAACVSGLVTVSTADAWTRFGQTVILLLIQFGGLAYMATATLVAVLLGLRVGMRGLLHLREIQSGILAFGAARLVFAITLGALLIEAVGALLLAGRFYLAHGYQLGRAAFEGVFYSVSAFCNAGFDLVTGFDGLHAAAYRTDLWLLVIIGGLVTLGWLGIAVLAEVIFRTSGRHLSLHAKLVLSVSALLVLLTMLGIYFNEARNPATLAGLATPLQRLVTSWFMAVSAPAAGFSPLDLAAASPSTLSLLKIVMTIGGGPYSTAGGIKVTTAAVLVLAIFSYLRLRPDVEAFRRRISGERVRSSLTLLTLYLGVILLMTVGVTLTEFILRGVANAVAQSVVYDRLVFEVFSAMSTTGFRTGFTPTLEPISRILIILTIFIGRLGPLAFVLLFTGRRRAMPRRYPEEPVMTG